MNSIAEVRIIQRSDVEKKISENFRNSDHLDFPHGRTKKKKTKEIECFLVA